MSLKTRIEAYTGSLGATVVTELVKDSIAKVVELIPDELLTPFTTPIVTGSTGADITNKKVLFAENGGYPARQVLKNEAGKYSDVNSIYYASVRCPVYYLTANKAYTLPSSGFVHVIDYSAVTDSDAAVLCLPNQFEEAVVIDVAISKLQEQLSLIGAQSIMASALDLPLYNDTSHFEPITFPNALVSADWTWTDVGISSAASTAVAALKSDPTPTTLPSVNLNAAGGPVFPAKLDPNAMTAPTAISLSIVRASTGDRGDGWLELVVPTVNLTQLTNTWVDITELTNSNNTAFANVQNAMDAINTDLLTGVSDNFKTMVTAMNDALAVGSEDIELGLARLQEVKVTIDRYMQRAEEFFKAAQFDLDVRKANAVQKQQAIIEQTHNELQAFSASLTAFSHAAQMKIAQHKEDLETYQMVSALDLQRHKENLELWQADKQVLLEQYKVDVELFGQKLQSQIQMWQADFQTKMQNAQLATQAAMEVAKMTNDITVQNSVQRFQSQVTKYKEQLEFASAKLAKRQSDIQFELGRQQQNFARLSEQYKSVSSTIAWLQQRFISFFAPFQKQEAKQ